MSNFNPEIRKAFLSAFEENCIELIVNAYFTALSEKKYQLEWMENDFSELSKTIEKLEIQIKEKSNEA